MPSNAQREGIATLITAPAPAMRWTGRIAPENSTAGKQSIGSASVAWATLPTAADARSPSASAASATSNSVTPIDRYVESGRAGRRSRSRSTPSIATTTRARNGTRTVTFDAT